MKNPTRLHDEQTLKPQKRPKAYPGAMQKVGYHCIKSKKKPVYPNRSVFICFFDLFAVLPNSPTITVQIPKTHQNKIKTGLKRPLPPHGHRTSPARRAWQPLVIPFGVAGRNVGMLLVMGRFLIANDACQYYAILINVILASE